MTTYEKLAVAQQMNAPSADAVLEELETPNTKHQTPNECPRCGNKQVNVTAHGCSCDCCLHWWETKANAETLKR